MTKIEFLKQLKVALEQRGVNNSTDILMDYEEHFAHALQNGKSEDEICTRLGSPQSLAMAFETKSMLAKPQQNNLKLEWSLVIKALGRLVVIAPFTLLVVLLPGILLLTYLITGWALVGGTFVGSLIAFVVGLVSGLFTFSFWILLSIVSSALAGFGITVAAFIFMYVTTKVLVQFVVDFIKWNLNFILDKRKEA